MGQYAVFQVLWRISTWNISDFFPWCYIKFKIDSNDFLEKIPFMVLASKETQMDQK